MNGRQGIKEYRSGIPGIFHRFGEKYITKNASLLLLQYTFEEMQFNRAELRAVKPEYTIAKSGRKDRRR